MTNGEKFKRTFKISQVDECDLNVYAWLPIHDAIEIPLEWWNAEYKEPTTKNDLGVDCVARQDVERFIEGFINEYTPEEELEFINLELDGLKHLPPAIPQEPQSFKWCTDCREYDQEKHCCHRWSKVIRDTVEEMKQEQKPILDKIFCIIHPLSIMSTPELEHKAIMQIAEMLEPLCLSEGEDKE